MICLYDLRLLPVDQIQSIEIMKGASRFMVQEPLRVLPYEKKENRKKPLQEMFT
jgi:hypothetical protein